MSGASPSEEGGDRMRRRDLQPGNAAVVASTFYGNQAIGGNGGASGRGGRGSAAPFTATSDALDYRIPLSPAILFERSGAT